MASGVAVDAAAAAQGSHHFASAAPGTPELALAIVVAEDADVPMEQAGHGAVRRVARRELAAPGAGSSGQATDGERNRSRSADAVRSGGRAARASSASAEFARR